MQRPRLMRELELVSLRLYGNRRGPEVFDFGVNMEVAHPTGFSSDAFGNEIDAGATFNGVAWTGIYNVPPEVTDHAGVPAIDTMNEAPAVATVWGITTLSSALGSRNNGVWRSMLPIAVLLLTVIDSVRLRLQVLTTSEILASTPAM